MRFLSTALSIAIAGELLAGCAGSPSSPSGPPIMSVQGHPVYSVYDDVAPARAVTLLHALATPDKVKATSGIYVSLFDGSDILGYAADNKANKKPICTVSGVSSVNDVAVDGKGDMIDPDGGSGYVIVHKGPTMCGKEAGLIQDSYGQPSDASSADAITGKIAVGNIFDTGSAPGSISICTLKGGCTANLTNKDMLEAGGVAMANNGDCWDNAKENTTTGQPVLIWFKGCAGGGKITTGFKSTYYGGIDIDNKGNLVIIDEMALAVYIYSGCNPACKVVGGPFALKAESFFGKLNKANTDYAAVDRTDGVVDVYSYSTKGIKYEYQFSNGLTASLAPEGVAQNPRSQQ